MKLSRAPFFIRLGFETPFFIFLTAILAGLAVFLLVTDPSVRTPSRLIPFLALMLVHIVLYWLAAELATTRNRAIVYLVVQGLIALAINLVSHNVMMIFGLYSGLIGITVGILRLSWPSLVTIAAYLGLTIFLYGQIQGWENFDWWPLMVAPMTLFVIIYVALYNRQAEAREQAQALAVELEQANLRLAEYAGRVEELTLSTERERMARELHDTLSQGLAGLILKLEAVDAHLSSEHTERAQAIIRQAMEQARTTLGEARRAIGDLRESPREAQCPADLLAREVERFHETSGIPCWISLDLPETLAPQLCETLQRTLAEGLANITRHANAKNAWVTARSSGGWLALDIRDDGVGFDPLQAARLSGHYGLLGLRERARLAQGTLEVISRPGQGTTLRMRLPLPVKEIVNQ